MIKYPAIERIDFSVDINKIIDEVSQQIFSYDGFEDQLNIQIVPGIENPFYGSRKGNNLKHKETDFTEYFFDMPYTNSILKKFNLVRTRVMYMKPKTCLTIHVDPTRRFHIPLITNENCLFVVDNTLYHMPNDGYCYLLDATVPHTVINASLDNRLHIVGVYIE